MSERRHPRDAELSLPSIHHICGIHELEFAPVAGAARVVSIISPHFAASPVEHIGLPLLVLRFNDAILPAPGIVLPSEDDIRALLSFDAGARSEDALVVHCEAGISRSTAALVLLLAQRQPGHEDAIFATLRTIRPQAWPNSLMVQIGDAILGSGGALVSALHRHYAIQAKGNPGLVADIIAAGRVSEVPAGGRG